jgi:hypothetical protein
VNHVVLVVVLTGILSMCMVAGLLSLCALRVGSKNCPASLNSKPPSALIWACRCFVMVLTGHGQRKGSTHHLLPIAFFVAEYSSSSVMA